LNGVIGLTAA